MRIRLSSINLLFIFIIVLFEYIFDGEIEEYFVIAFFIYILISNGAVKMCKSLYTRYILYVAALAIVSSLLSEDTSYYVIIRGLQYILVPIIPIYIGYYSHSFSEYVNIYKCFSLATLFAIIYNYYKNFNVINGFSSLRSARMGSGIAFITCIYIIGIASNEWIYSRKIDSIICTILIIVCAIGFSRTVLAIVIVCGSVLFFRRNLKARDILIYMLGMSFLLGFIIFSWIQYQNNTGGIISEYVYKLLSSVDELSTSQGFNNPETISKNWRGYEIYLAYSQFKSSSVIQKLFGQGLSGIYAGENALYVTTTGEYLPLLHNAYMSVLTYSGIFGLVYFAMFWINHLRTGILHFKVFKSKEAYIYLSFIISYMVINMFSNGLIAKRIYFIPLYYIGLYCSKFKSIESKQYLLYESM